MCVTYSLDDIVIFTPLSKKNLREIVKIQMHNVSKRLEDQDIDVVVRDDAADTIVTQSYDVTMGVSAHHFVYFKFLLAPLCLLSVCVLSIDFC